MINEDDMSNLLTFREKLPQNKEDKIVKHVQDIPADRKSKAPYNFVPINEKVVLAENEDASKYKFFSFYNEKLKTGYIDVKITTLGDVYIGQENKKNNFFNFLDMPCIPGSSLRGLIRTYVEILSFGKFGFFEDRTLHYRVKGNKKNYKNPISSCLPKVWREFASKVDIAEAIFGRGNDLLNSNKIDPITGRVYFNDCFLSMSCNESLNIKQEQILVSSPHPTWVRHYIVQENIDELMDYNTENARIRGDKLYWHNTEYDYLDNMDSEKNENNENMVKELKPIKKDRVFKGRVRFENLTDVELGALLTALKLPEGCHHKIGMGKPEGLGSIKIESDLFLSDRQDRYTSLLGDLEKVSADKQEFSEAFKSYVLEKLNKKNEKFWELGRLKEFKTLLKYDNQIESEKIKYMNIEEFKEKKILPVATEVIKK